MAAAAPSVAGTSSSGTTAEAKDTECCICHEPFTEPKLISCGHVLCRHCLLSCLSSQREAPCPLCRRCIISPDTLQTQSLEEMVDSFPTDVTMKLLVESEKLLHKDHTCQSCVNKAATSVCLHCRDFLCSVCADMHGRLSSTRHHVVETLASLTAEKLAAKNFAPCHAHANEKSQLYCTTHNVSICVMCATSKHRNCPEVKDLEERAEETRSVFTELLTTLSGQEARLDQAIWELDDLFKETEKNAEAAVAQIDQTFDHLESEVKRHRHHAKESTLGKFNESKQSIQDGRACLLQKRGALTTYRGIVERGKRMAASGDMNEMAVVMKKRVVDVDSSALLPADASTINTAALVINPRSLSAAETALLELGQVKVNITPASVSAQVFYFHPNCGANVVLSNNAQTAERMGRGRNGGIVVSGLPMVANKLYEVRLDTRDAFNGQTMWMGVVKGPPGSLILPGSAAKWTSAIIFKPNSVEIFGETITQSLGQNLRDVATGSSVGMLLDGRGHLHLYVDGRDQGDIGTPVDAPCFPFFEVFSPYRKITALPIRVVS